MKVKLISSIISGLILFVFAFISVPIPLPRDFPGPIPDSYDYVYSAESLLHGSYTVSWKADTRASYEEQLKYDGSPRLPQYPPGMSILLIPFVSIGGIPASIWLSFLSAITIGILIILLAFQLDHPLAAPFGLLFSLFTPVFYASSRVVMSDLPTTVIVLLLALTVIWENRLSKVFASLLSGFLPLLRIAAIPFSLAGIVSFRKKLNPYLVLGAIVGIVFLAGWQWLIYDSPINNGYTKAIPFSSLY